MFEELKSLLEDIWNDESDVSFEEFEKKVEQAWNDGLLEGTEYDWLLNNIGDYK